MEIVKTREEYKKLLGDKRVGYINIRRKMSVNQLHSGHEYVINYSKNNFDLTTVSFWNIAEMNYVLFRDKMFRPFMKNLSRWDKNGCVEWCRQKGVDIVLVPDDNYMFDYISEKSQNMNLIEFIDDVWATNNYPTYKKEENPYQYVWMLSAKSFCIYQYVKTNTNSKIITTWKNGEIVFIVEDFVKKYVYPNGELVILDPIKDNDGLYYSSSNIEANVQKNLINYFDSEIRRVLNIPGDLKKDVLSTSFSSLGKTDKFSNGFKIIEIYASQNPLLRGKFVNITYSYNGVICTYPFYSKNGGRL